jgi:hypothetical protein
MTHNQHAAMMGVKGVLGGGFSRSTINVTKCNSTLACHSLARGDKRPPKPS